MHINRYIVTITKSVLVWVPALDFKRSCLIVLERPQRLRLLRVTVCSSWRLNRSYPQRIPTASGGSTTLQELHFTGQSTTHTVILCPEIPTQIKDWLSLLEWFFDEVPWLHSGIYNI